MQSLLKIQATHLTKHIEKNHACDSAILPITSIIAGRPALLWVYLRMVVNYLASILEYLQKGGSLAVKNNMAAFLTRGSLIKQSEAPVVCFGRVKTSYVPAGFFLLDGHYIPISPSLC